ncbi:biotin--[acetyl-CoA-carboxylase] ligase [soil metagenome]
MLPRFHFDMTESTMQKASRLWRGADSSIQGLVVTAARQSAGRGRHGAWQSPSGGLWMTVAHAIDAARRDPGIYSLASALAAAEGIELACGAHCEIKWPNDLLLGGAKVGGILVTIERGDRPALLTGIGINANFSSAVLGEDLRRPATTLSDFLGRDVDLGAVRDRIVEQLETRFAQIARGDAEALLDAFRDRLAWHGEMVECIETANGETISGVLDGVDAEGRLLLKTESGTTARTTGELFQLSRRA